MNRYCEMKLAALRTAIDEIHARFEDRVPFDREEPSVGRLLRVLDDIVNTDLVDAGGSAIFLTVTLQSIEENALIHGPYQKAAQRKLETHEETFRFWLLCALVDHPDCLFATLSEALGMKDVVEAYYQNHSVLRNDAFVGEFLQLLKLIHRHPDCGVINFALDISALSLFDEEQRITLAMAGEGERIRTHRKSRVEGERKHRDPNKSHRKRSDTHSKVASTRVESVATQTDEEQAPKQEPEQKAESKSEQQQAVSHADAPSVDELLEWQHQLEDRDKLNRATGDRLRRTEERLQEERDDLEEQKMKVAKVLQSLNRLYMEQFNLAQDAREEGKLLDPAQMSTLLPKVVALLAEDKGHRSAGGAKPDNAHTPLSKVKEANESYESRLDDQYKRSFVQDRGGGDAATDVSSASESQGGGAPRAQQRTPTTVTQKTESSAGGSVASASVHSAPTVAMSRAALASSNKPFSWCAPPDTMPVKILGDRTWQQSEIVERERSAQLSLQRHLCAGCKCQLPQDKASNALFTAIQKVGQKALGDKPRRCHYCGEHFCHKCHTNKQCMLPFKVLNRWDFAEANVCNADHHFVQSNMERAIIHLPSTPVAKRPVAQKAAAIRAKLVRMYAVVFNCPEARTELGQLITSYYFSREHWYSLADMVRMRNAEGTDKDRSPLPIALPFAHSGSAPASDLLATLNTMADKADHHIRRCKSCSQKAIVNCKLCSGGDPVCLYDVNEAASCSHCSQLYHASCLDVMGCRCREGEDH